jgi:hypothetical protein
MLLFISAVGIWRGAELARASFPAPADLFMDSIANEDGDLGWHQLCPDLQQQMPRETLEQLTATQRSVAADQGLTMTIDHVADRPGPNGGEIRFYLATLHSPDGATGQKSYVITTEASGCVESVQ